MDTRQSRILRKVIVIFALHLSLDSSMVRASIWHSEGYRFEGSKFFRGFELDERPCETNKLLIQHKLWRHMVCMLVWWMFNELLLSYYESESNEPLYTDSARWNTVDNVSNFVVKVTLLCLGTLHGFYKTPSSSVLIRIKQYQACAGHTYACMHACFILHYLCEKVHLNLTNNNWAIVHLNIHQTNMQPIWRHNLCWISNLIVSYFFLDFDIFKSL